MELYELKYFIGVAKFENIHRASEHLNVSTASLSKAIARLESELGVKLFGRERRNIRLTEQGRLLQKKATEIIQLEEATRMAVSGHSASPKITFAGPEILIAKMGVDLSLKIKKSFPTSQFEFLTCSEESALNQVSRGEATLALTTGDLGSYKDLIARQIEETEFQIFIGERHPLYKKAIAKKTIPISEILEHIFVVPDSALLGQVGPRQTMDGWRDDQFPRKIDFRISGLNTLEQLLLSGKVLAYLPSYFCKTLPVVSAKISGCPYSCTQKVKIVSRKQSEGIWLNQFL